MHAAATVSVLQTCSICSYSSFPSPTTLTGPSTIRRAKKQGARQCGSARILKITAIQKPLQSSDMIIPNAASLMREKVEHLYTTVEDTAGCPLCWHSLNSCMICILLLLQQLRLVPLNNTHKQAARIKCISSVGCSMTFRVFLLSSSTPVISSPHCLCPTQTACHRASSSSQNKGANNSSLHFASFSENIFSPRSRPDAHRQSQTLRMQWFKTPGRSEGKTCTHTHTKQASVLSPRSLHGNKEIGRRSRLVRDDLMVFRLPLFICTCTHTPRVSEIITLGGSDVYIWH